MPGETGADRGRYRLGVALLRFGRIYLERLDVLGPVVARAAATISARLGAGNLAVSQ